MKVGFMIDKRSNTLADYLKKKITIKIAPGVTAEKPDGWSPEIDRAVRECPRQEANDTNDTCTQNTNSTLISVALPDSF